MERNFESLFNRDGYHHRSHNKTRLMAHLIFVTKYRKPILTGSLRQGVKQYIFESAQRHHWYIQTMETDQDHIHILLQYPPRDSIQSIVSRLKQESTFYVWKHYSHTFKYYYWAEKTIWSDGCFAASVGDASADTIRCYIENQG